MESSFFIFSFLHLCVRIVDQKYSARRATPRFSAQNEKKKKQEGKFDQSYFPI